MVGRPVSNKRAPKAQLERILSFMGGLGTSRAPGKQPRGNATPHISLRTLAKSAAEECRGQWSVAPVRAICPTSFDGATIKPPIGQDKGWRLRRTARAFIQVHAGRGIEV
jgi:hypothetical protein